MSHRGPIQSFTEVCLACMNNTYQTEICDYEGGRADIKARADKDARRAKAKAAWDRAFDEFWKEFGS